jgi:4-hydroxy-tetrahydrodipicolinate reductase
MIKVLIFGCGGSMGRVLADLTQASDDIEVAAGVDPFIKEEEFPIPVFTTLADCDIAIDVIVDFSSPKTVRELIDGALQMKTPLVIATTGHSTEDRKYIMQAAESLPIFQTANMSVGINLMADLLPKTADVLGNQFDIEIIEKHHNQKNDTPSGADQHDIKDIGIHAAREGTTDVDYHFRNKDALYPIP